MNRRGLLQNTVMSSYIYSAAAVPEQALGPTNDIPALYIFGAHIQYHLG